jgi:hypothetical protein
MKNHLFSAITTVLLLDGTITFPQPVKVNHIIDGKTKYFGPINAIAQDRLGYIWFGVGLAKWWPWRCLPVRRFKYNCSYA